MAVRISATMALLLFSLMAVARCVPLEAELATDAASAAVTTVPDAEEEGLLRFPSRDDSIVSDAVVRDGEVPGEEEEVVQPVAEPDPDRSHPDNHDCDGKEKKMKKHHQSSDDEEEEEEEKTKKKIHRHHHVGKTKTKKLTHHNKNGGYSDDEDEREKREKRWRKATSRSMFGRGRRSQREEAAKDEVNN